MKTFSTFILKLSKRLHKQMQFCQIFSLSEVWTTWS